MNLMRESRWTFGVGFTMPRTHMSGTITTVSFFQLRLHLGPWTLEWGKPPRRAWQVVKEDGDGPGT